MTNRREFLQASVVASTLPLALDGLLPSGAAHARADESGRILLHKAIFDDRYAEGRAFASAMAGFGVPAYALQNGDVTNLWYDELDLLWRRRSVPIAGITQFGPMFVLERFANERGMRIALRIEHEAQADGALAHVVTGPPETLVLARELSEQGVEWPLLMASLLAHCPGDCLAPVTHTVQTLGGRRPELAQTYADAGSMRPPESVIHYYASSRIQEGYAVPWDGPLFSWVIAPQARG